MVVSRSTSRARSWAFSRMSAAPRAHTVPTSTRMDVDPFPAEQVFVPYARPVTVNRADRSPFSVLRSLAVASFLLAACADDAEPAVEAHAEVVAGYAELPDLLAAVEGCQATFPDCDSATVADIVAAGRDAEALAADLDAVDGEPPDGMERTVRRTIETAEGYGAAATAFVDADCPSDSTPCLTAMTELRAAASALVVQLEDWG